LSSRASSCANTTTLRALSVKRSNTAVTALLGNCDPVPYRKVYPRDHFLREDEPPRSREK
jgi:hypothetical protein